MSPKGMPTLRGVVTLSAVKFSLFIGILIKEND